MLRVDHSTPSGRAADTTATRPVADLERRLSGALDFAAAVVADFGESGYTDTERPALSFGPEKVVAEAAMLAYAAHGATGSGAVEARIDALLDRLEPLVRSPRALADMALDPEQVFRRAVPHVLLGAMGRRDDAFDDFAGALCARVLDQAVDQPATVVAERRWISRVWGKPATGPDPTTGTVLTRPCDLLVRSREDPYGLTHLLFYVTDFARTPRPGVDRPLRAILADVEALVVRYLDHGDYDLVGELLMAWPQLRAQWSPTAAFAFGVLAEVEDQVGLLPCGNLDPARLARLEGAERTRYARAASYHTALVMGFLCAVTLRSGTAPPMVLDGPQYADDAWQAFRAGLADHRGDWLPVFDRRAAAEKRALAPMLAGLAVTRAMRRQDHAAMRDAIRTSRRLRLPEQPLLAAATELLGMLGAALELSAPRIGA